MPMIYHYCDANPLISIVRDGMIWLSSLRAMNDTGELDFFRRLAMPAVQDALKRYGRVNGEGLQFLSMMSQTEYYAACFSTLPDDLYQWQAYGQRGRGFSIGFDSDVLCPHKATLFGVGSIDVFQAPMATPGVHTLGISEVKYVSDAEISSYAAAVAEMFQPRSGADPTPVARVASMVNVLSAVLKSDGFRAENEYRMLYAPMISHPQERQTAAVIHGPLKDRKWRNGTYGITPYFEYGHVDDKIGLNGETIEADYSVKRAIREIILGPSCPENPEGLFESPRVC